MLDAMAPTGRLPKVFYLADRYISHQVAAKAYCAMLADMGCLTDELQAAEVVVHQEFGRLEQALRCVPATADCYRIAMAVWETDKLPVGGERTLAQFDEVWTPSLFSARALCAAHPRVFLLPHVVEAAVAAPGEAQRAAAAADALVEGWLGPAGKSFDVLAIGSESDPRKNLCQLRLACRAIADRVPNLRLICKVPSWEQAIDLPMLQQGRGELLICGSIGDAAMQALMRRACLVASAHRAEGWGLPLSTAMAHGVWTVATGFGGNLGFAGPATSSMVPYHLCEVGDYAESSPFVADAVWATPSQVGLEDQLVGAYQNLQSQRHRSSRTAAKQNVKRFHRGRVEKLLSAHLLRIGASRRRWPHL